MSLMNRFSSLNYRRLCIMVYYDYERLSSRGTLIRHNLESTSLHGFRGKGWPHQIVWLLYYFTRHKYRHTCGVAYHLAFLMLANLLWGYLLAAVLLALLKFNWFILNIEPLRCGYAVGHRLFKYVLISHCVYVCDW